MKLPQTQHVKPAIPRQSARKRNQSSPFAFAHPIVSGDQIGLLTIMNRAAFILVSIICLIWAFVFASIHSSAHAASRNNEAFQREWNASKVDLKTSTDKTPADRMEAKRKKAQAKEDKAADVEESKPKRKRRSSSTPPDRVEGSDAKRSQRSVCRSQCSLERMSCDQGRTGFNNPATTGFTNRSDQLRAAQSSCFLAVQSCLSRC